MNAAPRGRCRCSAGRMLAVAFDFDGEFKNFATAKIPRRNATDHDELYQPLDKLTDCQPAAHRVAQMVSRAANVAGLAWMSSRTKMNSFVQISRCPSGG